MWAIVCMISVGIDGLGIMRNIICIIIIVGDIKRLRLSFRPGGEENTAYGKTYSSG